MDRKEGVNGEEGGEEGVDGSVPGVRVGLYFELSSGGGERVDGVQLATLSSGHLHSLRGSGV